MVAFLLENAVFLLIGLQAWWIVEGAADSDLGVGRIVALCAATLAACIVLRLLWVFPARYLIVRPAPERAGGSRPPWTYTFILGWAGMRGVVTLAAAFVIPEDTEYREVLLLMAFTVVAGTLFLQGTTLPMLASRLNVPGPDPAEDALARATLLQQASKAGAARARRAGVRRPRTASSTSSGSASTSATSPPGSGWRPSRTGSRRASSTTGSGWRCSTAERGRVLEIRDAGSVASEVVDGRAGDARRRGVDARRRPPRSAARSRGAAVRCARTGDSCDDLEEHPAVDTVADPVLPGLPRRGHALGGAAAVPRLRRGRLLRLLAPAARHRALPRDRHPVIQSAEPGEDWRWCYVHHTTA